MEKVGVSLGLLSLRIYLIKYVVLSYLVRNGL